MALSDPKDTLAYHQSRVFTSNRQMSDIPCAAVVGLVSKYQKEGPGHVSPEGEALWFYGLNHGLSLIQARYDPLEPIAPNDLVYVKAYHARMGSSAVRAFYYLLLICTREARHNNSLLKDMPQISAQFGHPVATFFKNIKGGESGIHQKFLFHPPDVSIGAYVKSLQWVFYNSEWSGGYGGKSWGAVADCLVRFVTGEFTAEMMLDTNWTLVHNNGPIFNKGIFYSKYTSSLYRILDVQRSGQIPEAVLGDVDISQYVDPQLKVHMEWLKIRFPGVFGEYVDWFVVEALGAVKKYSYDKANQMKLHGMSELAAGAQKKAEAQVQAKLEADKKSKEVYEKSYFEIMPDLVVKKIERQVA